MKKVAMVLMCALFAFGCAATSPGVLKVQAPAVIEEDPAPTWESAINPFSFTDETKWQFEDAEMYPDAVVVTLERPGEVEPTHAFVLVSLEGMIMSYCYLDDGELKYYAIDMGNLNYYDFELPENDRETLNRHLLDVIGKHDKRGI